MEVPTVISLGPNPTPPDNFSPVLICQTTLPVFKSILARLPSDEAAYASSPMMPGENSNDSLPPNFRDHKIFGLSVDLISLRGAGGSTGSCPTILSVI